MARLTKQVKNGYFVLNCDACEMKGENCTPMGCLQVATKRLAAYEETGLEPEEIVKMGMAWEDSKRYSGRLELKLKAYQDLGPIDHLRDLIQAEKAGRLVVLPCKVGDTIWRIKRSFAEWPDISKPFVEADAFLYRDLHYFGKTAFLTREEAEAAMKEADHA